MAIEPSCIGEPAYRQNLPRRPESARDARRLVTSALHVWGLEAVQDSALLVVAELVANAVVHARKERVIVSVTLRWPLTVRVAVVDLSRVRPERHKAGEDDEGGRGLELVEALCDGRWGVEPLRWDKRVWADLDASGGPT